MSDLRQRTDNEIKAYLDGYKACFKKFRDLLDMSLIKNRRAADKMEAYINALNDIIYGGKIND